MGQVIIRNLDDEVIAWHRERARARKVSLEQELREALTRAARPSRAELIETAKRIAAMTPEPPPGQWVVEGWELIREDRDTR